jgi:RHS repeat-associated protein
MKPTRRASLASQLLAVTLCAIAGVSLGAPGDIVTSPAPVIGADPPEQVQVSVGDARVSPQTGALEYGYEFSVPPGRNGMEPAVALTYSSQAGLRGGVAAGWTLSLPEIRRENLETFPQAERWVSSMAGSRELVEVTEPAPSDTAKTFRAQNDPSYARYQLISTSSGLSYRWRVLTTDGIEHRFGDFVDGWYPLLQSRDPFGNAIDYEWTPITWPEFPENYVEWRLTAIAYTKNDTPPAIAPHAEVRFEYTSSPPACGGLPVGAQRVADGWTRVLRGASQLVAISTHVRPMPGASLVPVRRWSLTYDATAASCSAAHAPLRILSQITEIDPATGGVLRPGVTFTYGDIDRTLSSSFDVSFGTDINPPEQLGWGRRLQGNGKWSTLEAQLIDLDADARPDRMRDVTPGSGDVDRCRLGWARNLATGGGVSFETSPLMSTVPPIPWANADQVSPPLPPQCFADGCMDFAREDCSLSGQLSYYSNKTPPAEPLCDGEHLGNYDVYRYLDLDADGTSDLVTAVFYDAAYWDPPVPSPPPPEVADEGCPVLELECVDPTFTCQDVQGTEVCDIDGPALALCAEQAAKEECFFTAGDLEPIYARRPPPWYDEDERNEILPPEGQPVDPREECVPVRKPLQSGSRYPWTWYRGLSDGTFETSVPRVIYAPIALEQSTGDPGQLNGSGRASTVDAIIDLDGDGYLDAVHRASKKKCGPGIGPCRPSKLWFVWLGQPGGGFGPLHFWRVPPDAAPGRTGTQATLDGGKEAAESMGLHDVNGDGRPDLVGRLGTQLFVHWNLGKLDEAYGGFEEVAQWFMSDADKLSWSKTEPGLWATGVNYGDHYTITGPTDFDGDGLLDWHTSSFVRWSNGGAYTADVSVPAASILEERSYVSAVPPSLNGYWQAKKTAIDLDGDGLVDGADRSLPTARSETRDGSHRALLATVGNGHGLTTTIKYSAVAYEDVVTMSGGRLPKPTWVVDSIENVDIHANLTSPERTSHHYVGPVWNQDPDGRWGFRGFAETRAIAPSGSVTVTKFDYVVDWSGRESRTEVYASEADRLASKPATIKRTDWANFAFTGGLAAIITTHPSKTWTWTCTTGQSIAVCESNPEVLRTINVWAALPTASPLLYAQTQEQFLDHPGALDDGDWRERTTYQVFTGPGNYRLRVSNDLVEEREFGAWDTTTPLAWTQHIFNALGKNEIRTSVRQDASRTATTQREFYTQTGLLKRVRKPEQYAAGANLWTTHTYDAWQIHVATTTNELGHVVQTDTDLGTGLVTATRGPNTKQVGSGTAWQESRTVYDALGRPKESWVAVDNAAAGYQLELIGRTTYHDFSSPARVVAERRKDYGGSEWLTVETEADGHGRPIKETTRLFDAVLPDAKTTWTYDHRGHLVSFTAPDPSVDSGGDGVTYYYQFDSLGRPTGAFNPHGDGVQLSYDGLVKVRAECAVNAGGTCQTRLGGAPPSEVLATTRLTSDVFGRLVKVEELMVAPSTWATTTYEYTETDDLKKITNADGLVTELEHDWVGQRTAIRRGVDEGTQRVWSYTYNLNGKLTAEVVPYPAGALAALYTTTYSYDELDRERVRFPAPLDHDAPTREALALGLVVTSYDDGTNGKGNPTYFEVAGPSTLNVLQGGWSYDALGRVINESRMFDLGPAGVPISDYSRSITRTYNALGAEVLTTHADGITQTEKTYDGRGLPLELRDATIPLTIATARHNVAGRLVAFDAGPTSMANTKSQRHSFDDLGRLTQLTGIVRACAGGCEQTLVAQSYVYGATSEVNTLTSTVSALGTRTFELSYDDQHQLIGADDEFAYFADFQFSPGGTVLFADVTTPDNPPQYLQRKVTHEYDRDDSFYPDREAVKVLRDFESGAVVAEYQYDSLGNVTSRTQPPLGGVSWQFLYDTDAMRRATLTTSYSANETYFYDGAGQRTLAILRDASGNVQRVRFWFGESEIWYDGTGAVTERQCNLAHGMPMIRRRVTSSEDEREVIFTNPLGHTLLAADYMGGVAASYQYGPFGEILAQSGETSTHLRRFNGKDHDQLTNLYYYGARYFDPLALQWTQADPLYRFAPDLAGDEPRRMGLYKFGLNNPLRYFDPDGRNEFTWLSWAGSTQGGAKQLREAITTSAVAGIRTVTETVGTIQQVLTDVDYHLDEGGQHLNASREAFESGVPFASLDGFMEGGKGTAHIAMAVAIIVGEFVAGIKDSSATKRRVSLRVDTRKAIESNQPRNAAGEMIDPHTGQVLDPKKTDIGHKPGQEWRVRKKMHEEAGSTRQEVIETENDPDLYHLEDRTENRSHQHEQKKQ